jgi:ribosomal protein L5
MLINKYQQVLRTAMKSKFVMKQSAQLPKVMQVVIKVKAENAYDPITNVSLVTMLSGIVPQSMLVNMKKGTLLPFVTMSNHKWSDFMETLLPVILNRLADKVVAVTYASTSNSVNFAFKATDAMPFAARKL